MAKNTESREKTKTAKKQPAADKKTAGAPKKHKGDKRAPVKLSGRWVSVAALFRRQSGRKPSKKSDAADNGLRKLNLASAAVFIVLALIAAFLMQEALRQVSYGYLGRDALASLGGQTVFAPAWQPAFSVGIKWLVVAVLVLSAVLPVLYVTKLKDRYVKILQDRANPWRWVDWGVTAGLMVGVVALLSGVSDLMTLELIVGLVMISSALSWLVEKRNAAATAARPARDTFIVSVISGLLPWILIISYAINTVVFGMILAPWYVYALYAVVFTGWVLFTVNQWFQHERRKRWADYVFVERNYLLLSLATKSLFAVVLIVAFFRNFQ